MNEDRHALCSHTCAAGALETKLRAEQADNRSLRRRLSQVIRERDAIRAQLTANVKAQVREILAEEAAEQ